MSRLQTSMLDRTRCTTRKDERDTLDSGMALAMAFALSRLTSTSPSPAQCRKAAPDRHIRSDNIHAHAFAPAAPEGSAREKSTRVRLQSTSYMPGGQGGTRCRVPLDRAERISTKGYNRHGGAWR